MNIIPEWMIDETILHWAIQALDARGKDEVTILTEEKSCK